MGELTIRSWELKGCEKTMIHIKAASLSMCLDLSSLKLRQEHITNELLITKSNYAQMQCRPMKLPLNRPYITCQSSMKHLGS